MIKVYPTIVKSNLTATLLILIRLMVEKRCLWYNSSVILGGTLIYEKSRTTE